MKLKYVIFLILIIVSTSTLVAQEQIAIGSGFERGVLLKQYLSFGVNIHSQGWGISMDIGKNANIYNNYGLLVEFVDVHSFKEIKLRREGILNAKSFVYGKLNYIYFLRTGFKSASTLNFKPYWGGVSVGKFYSIGFNSCFTKPVYLQIQKYSSYYDWEIVEERYQPEKHDLNDILGRGSFFSGFNKIKYYPGIYLQGGFSFDFGDTQDKIRRLDIGASLDLFIKEVPIMAYENNTFYFITFFLKYNIGKNYNAK
ncbi:MAG TPA: hypothetical protein PLS14_03830 [Bacteroidales bacterium]|nr:hypothetical protein [Bacteroidales bacterium]HPZ60992.1 hypothetical protein [Bacteroidales bacterium]HQD58728.1 hypothetical protein [Bacteroidales bacterium]